jgi:hypothetical protein
VGHATIRGRTTIAIAVVLSLLASTFSIFATLSNAAAQDGDFGTASVTPETALVYVRGNLHTDSDQWVLTDELIQRSGLGEAAGEEVSVDDIAAEEPEIAGEVAFVLTSIDADQPVDIDAVSEAASDPLSMGTDIPSGFAVVIQPDDVEAVSAQIKDSLENSTPAAETSEYNGVTILFAPPADEFSDGYAYAQVNEDTLVIATIPEDLEPIIDTANGDIDPLSDNAGFTDLQGKLTTDSLVFGYVDGASIVEQALAITPESEQQIPEELVAQASGTVGFTFYADQPGFRFDSLIVPAEDAELPALTSFTPSLADRVPSDSLVFLTGSDIGPSGALDSVALLLASVFVVEPTEGTPVPIEDPEAYADEIFAQAEAQLGFNLKTDFVDQLVDEYATSVSVNDITSANPEINAVFVSGVDDATTVNDVLSKFSFLAASIAQSEEVTSRDLADGTSVYQIDASDDAFPMVIEFGVIGDQLVIGLNNGIDNYVDGPAEPLSENENYQAVFSNLPTEVTGASFINVPQILPILDSFATSMSSSTPDNDPACAEYGSQEEAQEAYDEDFNFDLDLDFDGEACEDFFAPAGSPEASPAAPSESIHILGVGAVTFDADGDIGQSMLIAIGE